MRYLIALLLGVSLSAHADTYLCSGDGGTWPGAEPLKMSIEVSGKTAKVVTENKMPVGMSTTEGKWERYERTYDVHANDENALVLLSYIASDRKTVELIGAGPVFVILVDKVKMVQTSVGLMTKRPAGSPADYGKCKNG